MTLTLLNASALIQTGGYVVIFLILFAETGLLVGFVLPGETLLMTAGFLAATGYLNIGIVILTAFVAAIMGDGLGYLVGHTYGSAVFRKKNSLLFNKDYIERAGQFYKKHGPETIILARFVPFVRTLAPVFAGVGQMQFQLFLTYNILGSMLWASVVGLFGYFLGRFVPGAAQYTTPIILVMIASALLLPIITRYIRKHKK